MDNFNNGRYSISSYMGYVLPPLKQGDRVGIRGLHTRVSIHNSVHSYRKLRDPRS